MVSDRPLSGCSRRRIGLGVWGRSLQDKFAANKWPGAGESGVEGRSPSGAQRRAKANVQPNSSWHAERRAKANVQPSSSWHAERRPNERHSTRAIDGYVINITRLA